MIFCAVLPSGAKANDRSDWNSVIEAAKAEGRLVLYTPAGGIPYFKAIVAGFTNEFGIQVDVFSARASEIRERVRIEQASGRAGGDLHHNGATTSSLMERDGAFVPHGYIPNLSNLSSPDFATEQRVAVDITSFGILANTRLVQPQDEPKSWKDLLDEKWRGKILADDMRALGGGAAFFSVMFEKFGRWYLEQLSGQKLSISRDHGNSSRRIGRGEFPLYLPYALSYYSQLKGLPVKFVVPEEGRPYLRFDMAVLKGAAHPNAARLFINYVLDQRSQLLAADAGNMPVVRDVIEKSSPETQAPLKTPLLGTTSVDRQDDMLRLARDMFK
jgi:iron(III) transport system substrate-binding protein